MSEIKNIRDQFISKLENDLSIDQINEIKTDLFGKNGLISLIWSMLKSFSSLDINWSLIFFISDILVDYFLKK